jgi:hypothetical protein
LPRRCIIDESPDKPSRFEQSALGLVYSISMPIGGWLKQRFLVFFSRCMVIILSAQRQAQDDRMTAPPTLRDLWVIVAEPQS